MGLDIITDQPLFNEDIRATLYTQSGRLLVDTYNSPSAGGICVVPINTGTNLGSTVYADQGILMTESIGIDLPHWMIHAGAHYYASVPNPAVANNGTSNILISGTTKTAHLEFEVGAEGKARIHLMENPTVSVGAIVSGHNANRYFTGPAKTVLKTGVILSNTGLLLFASTVYGGTGPTSVGGSANSRFEWMLATGKTYLFQVTNVAGQAKDNDLFLDWYEAGPNFHNSIILSAMG